jgi:hypothetical protein
MSKDLNVLKKSLEYLKEAITSPLFKAKNGKSDWSPSREYSANEHAAMKPHLDEGHSLQEAAHLSGVDATPQNHQFKVPDLSPAMIQKAKAAAKDWIGRSSQRDISDAKPEINPDKYVAGKNAEVSASAKEVAKSYGDALKEHKASIAHMSPEDQMRSVQKFKSDFHSSPLAQTSHVDAAKARADIDKEAKEARGQELYESRKNILLGGQGLGDALPSHTASAMDEEEPNVLSEEDLADIHGENK